VQAMETVDDRDEVEMEIIRERNEEIQQIEIDTTSLAEIMQSLSVFIHDQGQQLEEAAISIHNAEIHVNEAVQHLKQAESWVIKTRDLLFDTGTIVAGVGLGSLGFFGGPIVGVPCVAGGLAAAISVVAVRRKLKAK